MIATTTGNTYDFVIIGDVVVNADETAASASNIAYISAIEQDGEKGNKLTTTLGENTGTLKVRMYFQDGSDAEVKVSKIDGQKITAAGGDDYAAKTDLTAGKMYTYSELSDGTYDVKAVGANNDVGMDWVASPALTGNDGNSTYSDQKIGGYAIADDAVVFVQTGAETKMLTGKQVKNWKDEVSINFQQDGTQILTKSTNGIAYVKFAVLERVEDGNKVPGASNDKLYAYLTADSYQATVNGEKKAAYDVWTGTENVTLYEDVSNRSISAGSVIEYSEDGTFISDVKEVENAMAAITGFNDGTIAYKVADDESRSYDVSDNCVYIAINDDENEGMEGSIDTVTMANEVVENDTTYLIPNAYIVTDVDGSETVVVAVIFDADNSQLNTDTRIEK